MIKLGMNYKFESGNSDDATGTPDDAKGSSRAKGRPTEDLAKASQNSIASLVSVPFQNNTNSNVGPFNRTQTSQHRAGRPHELERAVERHFTHDHPVTSQPIH